MSASKKEKPKVLPKALTVANIINQRVKRILFTWKWYDAFKQPQDKGVWFVWGGSGSGKSTFVMMLCKEMALLKHKVFFNLLEEETDDTDFIERVDMLEMNDVEDCFLAKTYNYDEMIIYLKRKNSAKVVVIDSATYFFESFEQYQNFKKMFRDKIIIITGHARGNNPKFELEDRIKFDAKMKIFVNGYLALCKGRTIGPNGGRFIIWQEGYDKANGS
ncbi:ATP-binding protein [Flavobacterium psychrophilum]|uniref:ATP-binding protein n=1 Tax=Flavobacterium psychrophilum TaxID=96345 RepID=UPI000B7C23A0|nr:ATP-binding protein [Flavobacterium psychrophilum]EKT3963215.1 ATP-binding protein [Flavobacterium psychrophilum]EKT4516670.1 ATP-binding protein [Flavobacterium psychrophilum]ELM3649616.1 ATP-binding protein [Flavobacterium psychrophilum]ELM3670336.1 ATP-binding protein [Flavobacterium psychrophilum]ELM3725669.1 ATP-binding protein [Flavobacterium psychrophilum]